MERNFCQPSTPPLGSHGESSTWAGKAQGSAAFLGFWEPEEEQSCPPELIPQLIRVPAQTLARAAGHSGQAQLCFMNLGLCLLTGLPAAGAFSSLSFSLKGDFIVWIFAVGPARCMGIYPGKMDLKSWKIWAREWMGLAESFGAGKGGEWSTQP